jgi:hypothetical protein
MNWLLPVMKSSGAALTLPGEVDRISGNATLRKLNRRKAGAILTSVEE